MRAGRLKHRVIIKTPVESGRDSAGVPIFNLVDIATVWASVGYISGRERWASTHVINNYQVSVLIRSRSDLKENMQVHHGDRILDIKAILPEANGISTDMVLLCVDHGG